MKPYDHPTLDPLSIELLYDVIVYDKCATKEALTHRLEIIAAAQKPHWAETFSSLIHKISEMSDSDLVKLVAQYN